MKLSYRGNGKPYVAALYHHLDVAQVSSVLEALDSKGLYIHYDRERMTARSVIRRACAVIAFLSEHSATASRIEAAILLAKAEGIPVICVDLDGAPLPDTLKSTLFASNMIDSARYSDADALADRIMTADALKAPQLTKAQTRGAKRAAILLAVSTLLVAAVAFLAYRNRDSIVEALATPFTEADTAAMQAYGMTEADLQRIKWLCIVGDRRITESELPNKNELWDMLTSVPIEDAERADGSTAYSLWLFGGEETARGTITDLSLIGKMTNLETLFLCNMECADLTPLGELQFLRSLSLYDCPVESVEPLADCKNLCFLDIAQTNVTTLAPLDRCQNLKTVYLGRNDRLTGLDGLNNVEELSLWGSESLRDVSALSGNHALQSLSISLAPGITDLSALSGKRALKSVALENVGARDLSALADSEGLRELALVDVPVRDLSFMENMGMLKTIKLHNTNAQNLDFLSGVSDNTALWLAFSGNIADYSGLAHVAKFEYLHVNPRSGNYAAVAPYIQDATTDMLELHECDGVDFAALPRVQVLRITGGNSSDLAGLSRVGGLYELELTDVDGLASLSGLSECESIRNLKIRSCAQLSDVEGMYGPTYQTLELSDIACTPDFSRIKFSNFSSLLINGVQSMRDLTALDGIGEQYCNLLDTLEIRNMDWLSDLTPVRRLRVRTLIVPPQLEEQAEQLYAEKAVTEYAVAYPDESAGQEDDGGNGDSLALSSLDELDTLPETSLARVSQLCVVGDTLVDYAVSQVDEEWDDGKPRFYIVDNATGERTPVGKGTIDSFDKLSKLTGLHELELIDQPLTSVAGIQNLQSLRWLSLQYCPIADASPAFTLTELDGLSLSGTDIASIAGVQNILRLQLLDINDTQVTDIGPLTQCDFTNADENGGLELRCNNLPCEDFSALAAVPRFRRLGLNDVDASRWLPHIAGKPVEALEACGNCGLTDADIAALAALPGLTELHIAWNPEVTDLTPLLRCETLTYLKISANMEKAVASIREEADFELVVEG